VTVTLPHDDLRRSPDAGFARWAVDGPARDVGPRGSRTPVVATERLLRQGRRPATRLAVALLLAALGWWLSTTSPPDVLRGVGAPWLGGVVAGRVPEPTPEVASLAADMFLTERGRDLFYVARPELLGAAEFAGRCGHGRLAVSADGPIGCYITVGDAALGPVPSIVVYVPSDPRLRGWALETAAHELLHAAWDDLTHAERTAATPLLEAVVADLDPGDDLHARVAGSVGGDPRRRATELFAYVGTQVRPPGGLDPALETLYARYVADREALVAVHTGVESMLAAMADDVGDAQSATNARVVEHHLATATHQAETASLARYREVLEQQEAHLAGLPAAQQARWRLSWTWRDGTALPAAPAARTLAAARALLAQDEAVLAEQAEELRVAEAEIAAEQARVDELRRDLQGLWRQMDPGTGGP